jgi:choline dehydrogenase-like flavoprotein
MGGTNKTKPDPDGTKAIHPGGEVIHEVGGTIMGADAASSVTNSWSQTWDARNVFVADGGVFASNADKNPTLTIMALAWRTADHVLDEMRRGNI